MTDTPRGSPLLVSAQAAPETTVNEQILRTEAGANRFTIADRVTAPPGTCADGACYIIIATATGAFAGKEDQIAQAVGTNAASGWLYRTLGTLDEGALAYVQDEDAEYKWSGSAWATYGGAAYAPGGTDVAVADGGTGASTAAGARTNLGADLYAFGVGFETTIPSAGEVLARHIATDAFTIPANFASPTSRGAIETNPTASFAIDVQRQVNATGAYSTIGTITISTGGAFTFATSSGTSKSIAANDVLKFVAPTPADSTALGCAITIRGSR